MAWSGAAMPADAKAGILADKPVLFSENLLRGASQIQWRQSGSFASGSDDTDSASPTTRLWDGFTDDTSKPDSALATWYLIIDLGAEYTINAVALLGVTNAENCQLQIADNNAFTTRTQTVAQLNDVNAKRSHFSMSTGTDTHEDISGVRYARLQFTFGATGTPEIGEMYLGQARAARRFPDRPWGPNNLRSSFVQAESRSGVVGRDDNFTKLPTYDARWLHHVDAHASDFRKVLADDTDGGLWPLVWAPQPTSDESDLDLVWVEQPGMNIPRQGWAERPFRVKAVGQG